MYHFVLKNELHEIVKLSQWLNNTLAKEAQLSPKITFQLDLILEETITNIIDHAFDTPGTHDITVLFQVEANTITIQVIDSGKPFDPLSDHQVELPTTLEDAGKGGLGIHLIRSYARECHYQRAGDKNLFTVIVDIN